jgi:hypothetical protein
MSTFKLTLKQSDDFADWEPMVKQIISYLKSHYGLLDEEQLCNVTILDYLETWSEKGESQMNLKNLALHIFNADWRFFTVKLGEIVLVGDKYDKGSDECCENCGNPQLRDNGETAICDICGTVKHIANDSFQYDDYNPDDIDLFQTLGNILKP